MKLLSILFFITIASSSIYGQLSQKFKDGLVAHSNLTTIVWVSAIHYLNASKLGIDTIDIPDERMRQADSSSNVVLSLMHDKMLNSLDSFFVANSDARDSVALFYENDSLHMMLDSLRILPRGSLKLITKRHTMEEMKNIIDIALAINYKKEEQFNVDEIKYVQALLKIMEYLSSKASLLKKK